MYKVFESPKKILKFFPTKVVLMWPGAVMVRVLALYTRLWLRLPAVPLLGNNLRQVVHTRASVTKQYNLVAVKGH